MTKGRVDKIQMEEFEWRIENFSSLPGQHIDSPTFSFGGEQWQLRLFPKGSRRTKSTGCLDLYLHRTSVHVHPINMEFSLGLKTVDGDKDPDFHVSNVFRVKSDNWGKKELLSRSDLFERESDFLPSDVLTMFCTIWHLKDTDDASEVAIKKCSFCKMTLDTGEDISSHERKCMNKPIQCPECGDVIILKSWYDHECKILKTAATEGPAATTKPAASEKLCDDLKQIMTSGDHSDTTIKVKGEDFRLHRSILGARSPFFDSMFKTEMRENITGVVSIEDCEPNTFRSYVHFLYAGKVDQITPENACYLYDVADRYQEDQLKEECLQFMLNSISVDSFCDYTILALRHDEQKLLKDVTKFFAGTTKEIIRSVKWQNFLSEYPIQANELLIKALDRDFAP